MTKWWAHQDSHSSLDTVVQMALPTKVHRHKIEETKRSLLDDYTLAIGRAVDTPMSVSSMQCVLIWFQSERTIRIREKLASDPDRPSDTRSRLIIILWCSVAILQTTMSEKSNTCWHVQRAVRLVWIREPPTHTRFWQPSFSSVCSPSSSWKRSKRTPLRVSNQHVLTAAIGCFVVSIGFYGLKYSALPVDLDLNCY